MLVPYTREIQHYMWMHIALIFCQCAQLKSGCWWFGTSGQCGTLKALTVVLVVCALADFLLSVGLATAGNKSSLKAKS